MLDKLFKNFRNPAMAEQFNQNEGTYDMNLNQYFEKYSQNKDNSVYFEDVFKVVNEFSKKIQKHFSQLKHLSTDLAGLLGKTSKLIHNIAQVYDNYIKTCEEYYSKAGFRYQDEVHATNKNLQVGFAEWGSQLLTQKRFVTEHIFSFFHFKKHEAKSMSTLLTQKEEINDLFKKKLQALDEKKLVLFEAKTPEKWKLDYQAIDGDLNALFKNYQLVKPYMLPDVCLLGDQAS
jgi:hypothetical protein